MRNPNVEIIVRRTSAAAVQADCASWAGDIGVEYVPDLVVFVAKSGYLLAAPMAEVFGCEMGEIIASTPGGGLKDALSRSKGVMPQVLVEKLVVAQARRRSSSELGERSVVVPDSLKRLAVEAPSKVLVVDDSVDTGSTLAQVLKALRCVLGPRAEIRTACYCALDTGARRVRIDYARFRNTVVLTATGRTSSEHQAFLRSYARWHEEGVVTWL